MSKRTYITARRLEKIRADLRPTDWQILEDIDRLGLTSGSQLRRLHHDDSATGRRMCRLHLARLIELHVLVRLTRRVGGVRSGSDGFVYGLDVAGRRLVDPDRSRWWPRSTPSSSFLQHGLQVSELYVELRTAERRGELRLARFDAEPACWRAHAGAGGARAILKPDAYVAIEAGRFEDHFFIEVDRATESLPRIVDKAHAYIRYWQSGREQEESGVFPLVLWTAPSERRREQLVEALSRLAAEHWQLFAVTTSSDTLKLMRSDSETTLGQQP